MHPTHLDDIRWQGKGRSTHLSGWTSGIYRWWVWRVARKTDRIVTVSIWLAKKAIHHRNNISRTRLSRLWLAFLKALDLFRCKLVANESSVPLRHGVRTLLSPMLFEGLAFFPCFNGLTIFFFNQEFCSTTQFYWEASLRCTVVGCKVLVEDPASDICCA